MERFVANGIINWGEPVSRVLSDGDMVINQTRNGERSQLITMLLEGEVLTLTVLVATIDAQWEGMGDVGSARYEPALLAPCPTIRVLSYSN